MAVTLFDPPYPKTSRYIQISWLDLFIEPELSVIGVLHCENREFRLFVFVTLTLTRWPAYTNLSRIPWRYTGCANMNFLCQLFRKLSSDWHTDRETDRQTDRQTGRQTRPKLYITPVRGWSIIHSNDETQNWTVSLSYYATPWAITNVPLCFRSTSLQFWRFLTIGYAFRNSARKLTKNSH